MSWWQSRHFVLIAAAIVSAAGARSFAEGSSSDALWRPSTRSVSMQPPAIGPTCGACQKLLRPAWVTQYRDETYTVRRPVIETSLRDEQYVRYEPVTTFVPQQVDQGTWVDQQVVRSGGTATRLRWIEGGWTVDPATGREYWRLPMVRPVRVRQPDKVENVRVWKPNVVTMSVPKVSYQPRVLVRKVPVQAVRYVEERRVRQVPGRCRSMLEQLLAPGGATTAPTFVSPPPNPLPTTVNEPPMPPVALPTGEAPAPLPVLPKPEIDPRENVPGPFIVPQSRPGDDSIFRPRSRDRGQDRVA